MLLPQAPAWHSTVPFPGSQQRLHQHTNTAGMFPEDAQVQRAAGRGWQEKGTAAARLTENKAVGPPPRVLGLGDDQGGPRDPSHTSFGDGQGPQRQTVSTKSFGFNQCNSSVSEIHSQGPSSLDFLTHVLFKEGN